MDYYLDLDKVLKNTRKKSLKPMQFVSVAGGVSRRLSNNIRRRKSTRLSNFDGPRMLDKCTSPIKSKALSKVEQRKLQLEKWKQEKERIKKETAARKKKPFVAGVAHAPLQYVPLPSTSGHSICKPSTRNVAKSSSTNLSSKPNTFGRVTGSQTARNNAPQKTEQQNQAEKKQKENIYSFAPQNATFKPPQLKNPVKLSTVSNTKLKNVTFDPILPKTKQVKTNNKPVEPKNMKSVEVRVTRGQVAKENFKQTSVKPSSNTKNELKQALRNRKSLPASLSQSSCSSSASESTNRSKHVMGSENSSQSSTDSEHVKYSPILNRPSRKSMPSDMSPIQRRIPRKSIQLNNYTPKNCVPKSESSSEERLRSPKSPEAPMTPEQITEEAKKISPCVTMSRGKDNARREMKQKLAEGLLDEDASHGECVEHFRRQLQGEVARLTGLCDVWERLSSSLVLPDSAQEAVLCATGQARLLVSQKLQQFAALLQRSARPEPGAALVTAADLHGFWDMVFMQVENVNLRFKKLEDLQSRGWVEEQPEEVKKKVVKPVKRPVKSGASSRLREVIAAARKAKKEQEATALAVGGSSPGAPAAPEAAPPGGPAPPAGPAPAPPGDSKTFEAGFFCVRSPVRSPASTPRDRPYLLKAVLSSEAKKSASKHNASFAMLRASVLGKDVQCDGVAPLPPTPLAPVNLFATPARGILKGPQSPRAAPRAAPRATLVLFQDDHSAVSPVHSDPVDPEKDDKENRIRRRSRLQRQDAIEQCSPARRKSARTPPRQAPPTPRRSSRRKKTLQESDNVDSAPIVS